MIDIKAIKFCKDGAEAKQKVAAIIEEFQSNKENLIKLADLVEGPEAKSEVKYYLGKLTKCTTLDMIYQFNQFYKEEFPSFKKIIESEIKTKTEAKEDKAKSTQLKILMLQSIDEVKKCL